MGYKEELQRLRRQMIQAVQLGVIGSDKDIFETTLVQIMNEAEKQRARTSQLKEGFRKQLAQAEAQEMAYDQMIAMVTAVLGGFVSKAQTMIEEERERTREKTDNSETENEDSTQEEDQAINTSENTNIITSIPTRPSSRKEEEKEATGGEGAVSNETREETQGKEKKAKRARAR